MQRGTLHRVERSTENIADLMADMIESYTDLKVNCKVNLGGSNVALKALQNNDIQMFPDYNEQCCNYYQEETGLRRNFGKRPGS